MKKHNLGIRWIAVVIVAFCMFFGGATAQAALAPLPGGMGPILPPPIGFPEWYQDLGGLALGPCQDYNGFCTLLPPFCPPALGLGCLNTPINTDPAIVINPTNFPLETFYFNATNLITFAAKVKVTTVIGLEGTFCGLPPVVTPGGQCGTLRVNVRVAGALDPNATYTITYPYGTASFSTGPTGAANLGGAGQALRLLDGGAVGIFDSLLPAFNSKVGPFLVSSVTPGGAPVFHTDAASGNVYIGAGPLAAAPVTGGTVANAVTISGPIAGIATSVTSSVFFLSGKVVGVAASPQNVTFPPQRPGVLTAATSTATVTLTNSSIVAAATLGTPAITGANAADFTIVPATNTCAAGLGVNPATCTFQVVFNEPAAGATNGAKSAVITIPVTAPANKPPVVINLSGAIDTIAPTITATVPADGDTNIPANNALTATFSEPVTGVSDTTFVLTGPTGTVTAAVAMDTTNKIATLTPVDATGLPANLASESTYTATLSTTAITDLVGNPLVAAPGHPTIFSFVTTAPAFQPPAVISTTPADKSTGASVTDSITVTFNEAIQINPLSVNATTFFLSEGITGSVTYDPGSRTAKFTPNKPLEFFHSYTVTVTTGVKSLGGVPMAANFTFTFLTNGAPSAPSLYLPADGATGLALPVVFQWIKSKDIDNEPVTYHLWYCTNPGFLGCKPVDISSEATTTTASAAPSAHNTFAGLGGYGAGMLLAGFGIFGGVRFRRKLFFFIAVLAISAMTVAACGGKNKTEFAVPDPATIMTKSVSNLDPQTTYYWKVGADDGNGAVIESETRSFTTQ